MRRFLFVAAVLFCSAAPGQEGTWKENIRTMYQDVNGIAVTISETFDPDLLLKHSYPPPLVEMFGGRERYIAILQSAVSSEDGDGHENDEYYSDDADQPWVLQASRVELGDIGEIHESSDELQAVVELREVDEYSDRKEIFNKYQLDTLRHGGQFWYFVDGTLRAMQTHRFRLLANASQASIARDIPVIPSRRLVVPVSQL